MVNVSYTGMGSDLVYNMDDGTQVIYNLGDMAWGESLLFLFSSLLFSSTTARDAYEHSHCRHGSRVDNGAWGGWTLSIFC